MAVVRSRGEEGASWKDMENAGKRQGHTRNVGVFFLTETESKEFSRGGRERKARMMKQAFFAMNGGDWQEYKSIFKVQAEATGWPMK